jgi:hypothetical protein
VQYPRKDISPALTTPTKDSGASSWPAPKAARPAARHPKR